MKRLFAILLLFGLGSCKRASVVTSSLAVSESNELSANLKRIEVALGSSAPEYSKNLSAGATLDELTGLRRELDGNQVEALEVWFGWHNGASGSGCTLIPLGSMTSLKDALQERKEIRKIPFIGKERKSGIKILDDGCGDGYYLDVTSSSPRVFYHMIEDGGQSYYGSLAQFSGFIASCWEAGLFVPNKKGYIDYDEAEYLRAEEEYLDGI